MTLNKNFLLKSACAMSILIATPLQAADTSEDDDALFSEVDELQPAVLFKIHDVQPVRNRDGKVISCEFNATFYNRSDNDINNIVVDLTWKDKAIDNVIQFEKGVDKLKMQEENYNNNGGMFREPQSETEKKTPLALTTSLKVPDLKPYRQVSLHSRIDTDRCFLMINDVDFKFGSCNVVNSKSAGVVLQNGADSACGSLFKYVSAQDPEYYREFKKVSFNEEKKVKLDKRKKEEEELKGIYDKIVSNLSRATDIMGQIR